ncbi:MAG: hypothetical protein DRJ35_00840 [Thermoprotei archaeon]|nr:MAG: hypothetical protein DRJ35_00840 [Thermoprotei archaeon]
MSCHIDLNELYNCVRKTVLNFLPHLGRIEIKGTYVFGTNYDRLKYMIAKTIARILSTTGCFSEIYYADIASGEFITGQIYFGRDVDIILFPKNSIIKDKIKEILPIIEKTINNAVADAIKGFQQYEALERIIRTNGIVEFHLDDTYTRAILAKKKNRTLSDINAIRIYPDEHS